MTGIDKRYTEDFRQLHRDITPIGIMAVDDVGNGILTLDVFNGFIHIFIKMRPKQLFADVFFSAALNTHNAEFSVDLLDGLGVVFG